MDMGTHDAQLRELQRRLPHAQVLPWTGHLDCIRQAMQQCRTRAAWVVSSWVDYRKFDWLWEPSPWQADQIHCWPNMREQFGDTFLVPREPWQQQQQNLRLLEHFQHVNFDHESMTLLPWQHLHQYDSAGHLDTVQQPLDVVFISNGEPNAESNYEKLLSCKDLSANRVHRIDKVNGRVAAYHAAAQISRTPWFFAVFAKLEVDTQFDWSWQPRRWEPKHHIFYARNPVNGLVYGHQAMIAYNRELVLKNTGQGLDFTLDQPHEVVPIVSGTAYYDVSPWQAWRTAFREVLKLRHSLPDSENEYRLHQWLNGHDPSRTGSYWSQWGAQDAMQYYDEVRGDFDQLKKSYEWEWLASYALLRRNLTADL